MGKQLTRTSSSFSNKNSEALMSEDKCNKYWHTVDFAFETITVTKLFSCFCGTEIMLQWKFQKKNHSKCPVKRIFTEFDVSNIAECPIFGTYVQTKIYTVDSLRPHSCLFSVYVTVWFLNYQFGSELSAEDMDLRAVDICVAKPNTPIFFQTRNSEKRRWNMESRGAAFLTLIDELWARAGQVEGLLASRCYSVWFWPTTKLEI